MKAADNVIREIAKNQNVVKGMSEVMRGPLLDTNARRIKEEGLAEGIAEGMAKGIAEGVAKGRIEGREEKGIAIFLNLIGAGISREEAQKLAEIENDLVEKALNLQKT